jgi:SAM-dependent methyltransferase
MLRSEELGLPIEYQQFPEFFDIPSNAENMALRNQIIEAKLRRYHAKNILDLTCGTGAQVFYLKHLGYDVIGSDFSPGLLDIAREKAKKENLIIDFIDGDMRTAQIGIYDAVITIDNAIGHLVKTDFAIAIENIYDNLKSDGIYIFDILNLDAMTDEVIKADSEKMTSVSVAADGTAISNVRESSIDRKHGILTAEERITMEKAGVKRHIENVSRLQIYDMKQLTELLSQNGFKVLEQEKIDAYTFEPNKQGYSILTVAQKVWR